MTSQPVENSLAFFGKELAAQGWSAWSTKDAAKIPPGEKIGESTDKGGRAYFVHDNRPPVMLTLRRTDDGRTRAEIQVIPATDLNPAIARNAEIQRRAREEAERTAAQEAAKARMAQSQAPIDAMTAEIMKEAQRATREALSGATPTPARPLQQQTATNEAPLKALAGNEAPVPVPDTAEDVENDDGKLEFTSSSSVAAIAAFIVPL